MRTALKESELLPIVPWRPDVKAFAAEASDLGWKSFPEKVTVDGVEFVKQSVLRNEGEIVEVFYTDRSGNKVEVFNE